MLTLVFNLAAQVNTYFFFRKFHTHILQFDGQGYWEFSRLNCSSRLDLKKEKDELLLKPNSKEKTDRLHEINRQLGEDDDE